MMSFVDPEGVLPLTGAGRVGSDLREARERLGWKLADVASGLRIRLPYLEAIEAGRLSELPGAAYAMGFVRTYATSLGLDPEEVVRRFRAEAQEIGRKTPLSFPAPVPTRGIPAGAVVLLGILIAGGAYVGWYRYSGSGEARVGQTSSAPPERLAAMAPSPAPVAPSPSPQVASILPSSPPAAITASAPVAVPVPVPVPVPVAIAPPAPVALPTPVDTRLVLRAKSGFWVQVREKGGRVLLNRVLKTGETWPVPPKGALLLTTSNAGALELLVDGTPAPALGPAGSVRRNVPLDADSIKAGKAAGQG